MTNKILAHLDIFLQSLKYEEGLLDSNPAMHSDFGTIYISQKDLNEYEKILEKRDSSDYTIFREFNRPAHYQPKILNSVPLSEFDTSLRNSLISPDGKLLDIPEIENNLTLWIDSFRSFEDIDFIETAICEALWDLNKTLAKNTQKVNRNFDQFVRDYILSKREIILEFLHKEQLALRQRDLKWFNIVRRGFYFNYTMPLHQIHQYLSNKKETPAYIDYLHFMKFSLEIGRRRKKETGLFDPLRQIRKQELRNMKLISKFLDKEILDYIGNPGPGSPAEVGKPDPESLDGIREVGSGKSGRKLELLTFKYLSTEENLIELFNYLDKEKWIDKKINDYHEFKMIFSGSEIDHSIKPITWTDTKATQPNVNIAGTLLNFIHNLADTGFIDEKYLKPASRNPVLKKSFKMRDGSEPNFKNLKYNASVLTTKTANLITFLNKQKCPPKEV